MHEHGKIVYLSKAATYAFIRPDTPGEKDVFAHISALPEGVVIGDRVTFKIGADQFKPEKIRATEVRFENGDREEPKADAGASALADGLRAMLAGRLAENKKPS